MLNIIWLSVVVLFLVLQSWNVCCETEILVNTANGVVRGTTRKTRTDEEIFAFFGVRYAEPPIEQNRFRPPIPAKPWKGVYDATKENIACHHTNAHPSYVLTEDCLVLDIFTKDLSGSRPVIVFIHGGGFAFGAKSDVSPTYLLERNVVLVSINYRLHAMGFFSTGTAEASGNYGLKDQVQALKWIQDNIHGFGGDPHMVTLNGHSAGGMSVSLHLVSPMSRGLFQRAIVMSGSSMSHQTSATRENSKLLLERTNCDNTNLTLALECLRKLPVELISEQAMVYNECRMLAWNYDIESEDIPESERFLIEDPTIAFLEGRVSKVPIIAGISSNELDYYAHVLKKNKKLFTEINQDFSKHAPNCFIYYHHANNKQISTILQEYYFENKRISEENIQKLGELYSDSIIGFGMYRFLYLASLYTNVYFYQFNYLGRYSHYYNPDGKTMGVLHGDELQYLYVFKKIAPIMTKDDPENLIIERMTSWWAEFAKTGNPNSLEDEYIKDIDWLPNTKNGKQTLYINSSCHMGETPNLKRYLLWESMFSLSEDDKDDVIAHLSDEL